MANNLTQNLLSEKKSLEARIADISRQTAAIDELLKARGHTPVDFGVVRTAHHGSGSAKPTVTKGQAIKKALTKAGQPVMRRDLPALMEREGYVFRGKEKLKALSNVLYGVKKLPFVVPTEDGLTLRRGTRP